MDLTPYIRAVPDFPKPGILFRDISPLLADCGAFAESVRQLEAACKGLEVERVVGIESRGFLWGIPLAQSLGVGFVALRKSGKLPGPELLRREYELEYGHASLEIQPAQLQGASSVLLVDDLLATGGTARAGVELLREAGVHVAAILFVIELTGLGGRERLADWRVESLLSYGEGDED
jgi:adenine phosphoribosyltransferase